VNEKIECAQEEKKARLTKSGLAKSQRPTANCQMPIANCFFRALACVLSKFFEDLEDDEPAIPNFDGEPW
jgi:hypothetical protein